MIIADKRSTGVAIGKKVIKQSDYLKYLGLASLKKMEKMKELQVKEVGKQEHS